MEWNENIGCNHPPLLKLSEVRMGWMDASYYDEQIAHPSRCVGRCFRVRIRWRNPTAFQGSSSINRFIWQRIFPLHIISFHLAFGS